MNVQSQSAGSVNGSLWLPALFILAALIAGLIFSSPSLSFDAAQPASARYLSGFSAAESNGDEAFRWSERDASLQFFGLTRRPLIVDLRMASPRPPDAVAAETYLVLGSWASNTFIVGGEWRHYSVLLPARPGAPDVQLLIETFRPAKSSDSRRLGAALSHVTLHPADRLAAPLAAIVTLGIIRALAIILFPFATLLLASRRIRGRAVWRVTLPVALVGVLALARPIDAVAFLPDLWLAPVLIAIVAALLAGVRARMGLGSDLLVRWLSTDAARLWAVALAAFVQGLIFLLLVPPWQHYDEPAHFEYAWLLAFHPTWPVLGTVNPAIAWIGGEGRALSHPPTYHLLVSLPLRLAHGLDVVTQLYIARGVSLAFFVATIVILGGIARTIAPAGHSLRWMMPLVAALIPPFADIMTSVNNDVGAILAFSLFLWGSTRALVSGLTARRTLWVLGSAALAAAMKNVALVAIPLALVVCLVAVGMRRQWPWRRLTLAVLAGLFLVLALALTWGDPADWYRYGGVSDDGPARIRSAHAIHGSYALRLAAGFSPYEQSGLAAPIPPADLPRIAGDPVTLGAWVWASRPLSGVEMGMYYNRGNREVEFTGTPLDIGVEPRFVTWTFEPPRNLTSLQVYFAAPPLSDSAPPAELFVDGVILTHGAFPADPPPLLDGAATGGQWNGQAFVNLVRNPSAEQAWPYIRPQVERASFAIVRRSPSRIVASLLDIERVGPIVLLDVMPDLIYRSFATFGWGEVALPWDGWRVVFPLIVLLALAGSIWRAARCGAWTPSWIATGVLVLIGALVWANAALRILPALIAQPPPFPRYGFPAIGSLALLLTVGWMAFWPVRWRSWGMASLIASLLILNGLAYAVIWWRWYV